MALAPVPGAHAGAEGLDAAAPPTIVSADLTPDGFDRYQFGVLPAPDAGADRGPTVTLTSTRSNRGANLRTVWWLDGARPTVDQESCVTWTEHSGPIVQAGVALRVRRVDDHTQAITVTNNIMWGARNGWNVHLWNGGGRGELIGQSVLSYSFGSSPLAVPPLPWRLCARVVGTTLEFKAWSLALHPGEPAWSDPGFGTSFFLPRGWIYPGQGGWYAGHLQPGDTTVFGALRSAPLHVGSIAQIAIATHTVADHIKRQVAASLVVGVQPVAV